MPDYGWAYINLDALSTISGPTGSLTFRNGSQALSGTSAFIYATASHKIGIGVNVPGALTPATLPSYILDVSASAGDTTAFRTTGDIQVSGNAYVSGTLAVESLHAQTVISSSNLIVRDPLIGMGFGDGANETGSVGDRGLILGLAGNLNQAILWDQTSGSFVIGKVGAQGPDKAAFDIPDGNLSTVRLGYLTASNTVSASEYHGDGSKLTGLVTSETVSSYTNAANNRVVTSVDSSTINGEASLTFDGTSLVIAGNVSGSGTLQAVGATLLGNTLAVSGSTTLQGLSAQATTATTISGSSTLQAVGAATLGSTLNVSGAAAFASTVKAGSLGADTDNTVVIVNGSNFLKTDEIDARVWGTTLVDGTGGAGQIVLWNDSNTVQGSTSLTYNGSTVLNDNNLSGSGTFENVGAAFLGNSLAVTGSTTLQALSAQATTATTISGSSTLEVVGATVLGNTLAVSGTVSVTSKIDHAGDADTHLKFDTDKIEFIAGNETLLTLTEDTQDIVVVGDGGDVDFQVKTTNEDHTLFVQGSNDLIGIRNSAPTAVLHLSQSGAGLQGVPEPLFRIDHPGDASGKQYTEALFYVTGTIPDDYFEAYVGINTASPEGALHVKSKEGENAFIVKDNKVAIGHNSAESRFYMRQGISQPQQGDVFRMESILNDDTVHNLFYVSGSTNGNSVFGSMNTGSNLAISGSSHLKSVRVQYSGSSQDTNVLATDYVMGVDSSGGAHKIFLQSAAAAGKGRKIVVKDTGNNAGSNNIKITGSTVGDLIEYANETLINANKGAKTLVSDGVSKWFVVGSA